MPPKKKQQTTTVERILDQYPEFFRKTSGFSDKQSLFKKVVEEENWYRELFAQDRTNKAIDDPHLLLVDAHANQDIFKIVKESPEEAALPRVFSLAKEVKKTPGDNCIVDAAEFERNFDVFTEAQLRFLNWNNVFAAGGSVLAALMPVPKEHAESNQTRRNYYHKVAYRNSDVDLFIYGLNEEEANKKLEEVYFKICESLPCPALCFRSKHAVSIVSQFPYRHIQIILRLYKSPAEILMGFDVDSCSVGFDGKKVWMTPRAHRALTHQYNQVDMSRRSPTYEQRLAKYSSRGFAVLVPTLDRHRIDPQLFERRFDQLQGLAKLILLEKLSTPEARQRYKNQQRLKKLRPPLEQKTSFLENIGGRLGRAVKEDQYVRERIEDGGSDASDYSTVFLPWSPNWNAEAIRKLMYTKDMILNSKWYDPTKKYHTHPCFFGTATEVIRDCCGKCPVVPAAEDDPESPFVRGVIAWVIVNPGAQKAARIGSFHPITEGDWTEGAYVGEETSKLCTAVAVNDAKKLQELIKIGSAIKKNSDQDSVVDARDCLGRTPLMIAAMTGAVDCAKILLKNKARVSAKAGDGRTAFLIASAYGNEEICKLIIARGKELVVENQKKKEDAEKNKKKDKKGKKSKPKKSKKKGSDDEDDDEDAMEEDEPEDEEMDEDEENEDEENEENEDEEKEEDEDFDSIKSKLEQKKKEQQEALEAEDPSLAAESNEDVFDINWADWDLKFNALHYAIFFGWTNITSLLISEGMDIKSPLNYEQESYSLLHLALLSENLDIAKLLLEKGCPVNYRDKKHEHILHKAAFARNLEFIKLVVEHIKKTNDTSFKFNELNNNNKTLLNIVIENGTKSAYRSDNENDNSMDVDSQDVFSPKALEAVKYLVEEAGATVQYGEDDLPSETEQQLGRGRGGHSFGFHHNSNESKITKVRRMFLQPLHQAVSLHSVSLTTYILSKKPSINYVNTNYDTPLDTVERWFESQDTPYDKESRDYNKQQWDSIKSDYKEGTFAQDEYLRARKASGVDNPPIEVTPEQKDKKEKEKKEMEKLRELLKKNGAKKFSDKKLDNTDSDLSTNHSHRQSYGYGITRHFSPPHHRQTPFSLAFFNLTEQLAVTYNYHYPQQFHNNSEYLEMYEAVWSGDIKKLNSLTVDREIGKQIHINSRTNSSYRTPLLIAMERGNADMVKRVLEISLEQHTPLKFKDKKKDEKGAPLINNYDLSRIMANVKPGAYIDPSNLQVQESKEVDLTNMIQFNCIVSTGTLLISASNDGRTVLHTAVDKTADKALAVLFDFIKNNEKKIVQGTKYDEEIMGSHPKQRKRSSNFDSQFLWQRYQNMTPFEYAIAVGNIKIATMLLEVGAVDDPKVAAESAAAKEEKKKSDDDIYEGLDVGGKKMDWVKERQNRKPKRKVARGCLHIASAYNQSNSIDFLLNKNTLDIWLKHVPSDDSDNPIPTDLNINGVDEQGRTVYHYAVLNEAIESLKKLSEIDKKSKTKIIDIGDKEGTTPLIYAINQGKIEIAKILLDSGADVGVTDKTRNWNAVHHCAAVQNKNTKDMIDLLLKYAKKPIVNAISKNFKQSPLVVASYYNNTIVIKALLAAGTADISLRDASGDLPLHYATKRGHEEVVRLLLPKDSKKASQVIEDGVGLTPLDCAMLKLLSEFHGPRRSDATGSSSRGYGAYGHNVTSQTSASIAGNKIAIYKYLLQLQGNARDLVDNEVVRENTYIVLAQTNAEVLALHKQVMAEIASRKKYNPYADHDDEDSDDEYDDDDEDDDDYFSNKKVQIGEMHSYSVQHISFVNLDNKK